MGDRTAVTAIPRRVVLYLFTRVKARVAGDPRRRTVVGSSGDARGHDGRSGAHAVRHDVAVPLPVRPADARPRAARRSDADAVVSRRRRGMAATDPLLRNADAHQLRDRRRDRPRSGVPVRHELVGLLGVRRRRLRCAARDRGPRGVHARVDVPGPLDLRLGSTVEARPPRDGVVVRHRKLGSRRSSSSPRILGCSGPSARPSPTAAPS